MTAVSGTMSSASPGGARLAPYAVFAAIIAAAGLPIYIHAPKVYADAYGISLSALGFTLFGLRLLDVVQDPALGWLASRLRHRRRAAVSLALCVMAASMIALFAIPPLLPPLAWFALMLALLFSAFSFLTITFYAQGVSTAAVLGPDGHLRLARWRESGALLGVCLAAALPGLLLGFTDKPFAVFAIGFALTCVVAGGMMNREWRAAPATTRPTGLGLILRDPLARRLLMVACVNAAPVAVSSTLFLFFVDARLGAPEAAGFLLLAFFLAAAASAPGWTWLAQRHGPRPTLLVAMTLAVAVFGWALWLGEGDVAAFAVISVLAGATVGADLALLPAVFARRMQAISPGGEAGFGLWGFMSKATLALAAVAVLPALEASGFDPSGRNDEAALLGLSIAYAGLPCLLKLCAIALLWRTDLEGIAENG